MVVYVKVGIKIGRCGRRKISNNNTDCNSKCIYIYYIFDVYLPPYIIELELELA